MDPNFVVYDIDILKTELKMDSGKSKMQLTMIESQVVKLTLVRKALNSTFFWNYHRGDF